MAINKNKINDNALRFIQKGQIKKAIKEYDKILAEDPGDVRTLLKKGDLLVRIGDRAQAVDSYLQVADTYSKQGFHLKAVAVFKQILKIDSSRVNVNLRLAEEYQNLGIVGDAMSHLQIVAAYYEQNDMGRELLEILRRIVDLDPDNIPSRIKLAEMYSREGMVAEAVEEFSRAAEDLKAANRIEDYIKVSERLIYHDNSQIDLIKELANIYLQRGDTKRALGKLQICFKADPQDLTVLNMLAQAFQDLNQLSKTVSVYKEIAKIHQEQGELDRAEKMYRRVLELSPEDPEAQAALQQMGGGVEEMALAEEDLLEIAEEPAQTLPTASIPTPDDEEPTLYENRPEIVLEAPGNELVEEELPGVEEVLEIEPEIDEIVDVTAAGLTEPAVAASELDRETISRLLTETSVYIKYGLQSKAYEHLTKVFELDPNNIEAHDKLREIYMQAGQLEHAAQELVTLVQLNQRAGHVKAARNHLQALFNIVPDHPQGLVLAQQLGVDAGSGGAAGEQVVTELDDAALEIPASGEEELEVDIEDDLIAEEDPTSLATSTLLEMEGGEEATAGQVPTQELSFDEGEETVEASMMPTGEMSLDEVEILSAAEVPDDVRDIADAAVVAGGAVGTEVEEVFDTTKSGEQELIDLGDDEQLFEVSDDSVSEAEPVESLPEPAEVELTEADELPLAPEPTTEPSAAFEDAARSAATEAEVAATAEQEVEEAATEEDLEDELDELDFFIQQKLVDEAREELERLLESYGERPELVERRQLLERLEDGGEVPVAAETGEEFDLAAELESEVEEDFAAAPLDDDFQYSVEDVFSEFKKGVEKVLDSGDSATHYDLGIAYKEMGLMDDAIHEFQIASQDQSRQVACLTMIGLCLKEKGQYSEAVNRFKEALHGPDLGEQEATGIYYEMGNTYELLGDNKEAAFYYNKVHKRDANFRDVASKLKKLAGSQGAAKKDGPGGKKPANPKNNISYM